MSLPCCAIVLNISSKLNVLNNLKVKFVWPLQYSSRIGVQQTGSCYRLSTWITFGLSVHSKCSCTGAHQISCLTNILCVCVYINCEICNHLYIIALLYRCVKYIIHAFHFNTKIEVVLNFFFIYLTLSCSESWLAHLV